eukprot:scaffold294292_cov36-Tisochrysis_lutea.AAC.2
MSLAPLSRAALLLFFLALVLTVARTPSMFSGRFARTHRLTGLSLLLWLVTGAVLLVHTNISTSGWVAYDLVLGLLGSAATFSAAADFRVAHARVSNLGSGTLDEAATVTHSEMLEHGFYQLLNLVQILSLHALGTKALAQSLGLRAFVLVAATAPWLFRGRFPVNRFSDNYTRGQDSSSLVAR